LEPPKRPFGKKGLIKRGNAKGAFLTQIFRAIKKRKTLKLLRSFITL